MPDASVRSALRRELTRAMKERDRAALAAYRNALAAIDNAGAVPLTDGHRAGAIEQSVLGVGRADVARQQLTEAELRDLVRQQAAECDEAAVALEPTNADAADALRRDSMLLLELLAQLA